MPDTPLPSPSETAASIRSPLRAWSSVTALAVAVFTVTATEMMPIGLLPPIAADLGVSTGAAGLTITMYGIVAGLAAPVMTSWTRRLDRRTLVLWIIGVFVIGNLATALVTTYAQLLVVRLVIGMCHGLMWSIIASIAVRLVPPASAAKATAIAFSGISLALVLGVPAGTLLGDRIGWRAAFAVLATVTALTWVAVLILVPALPSQNWTRLRELGALISGGSGLRTVLLVTALVVIGNYAAYTYIAPFLIDDAGASPTTISGYLLVYGVAGVVGNFVAGAVVARANSLRVVLFGQVLILTISMALLSLAPGRAGATAVLIAVWGWTYSGLPVVLQTLIFRVAPSRREAGTSLYVMVFNVSIAVGALVGAVGIDTSGATAPIVLGALVCSAGACMALFVRVGRTADARATQTDPAQR